MLHILYKVIRISCYIRVNILCGKLQSLCIRLYDNDVYQNKILYENWRNGKVMLMPKWQSNTNIHTRCLHDNLYINI